MVSVPRGRLHASTTAPSPSRIDDQLDQRPDDRQRGQEDDDSRPDRKHGKLAPSARVLAAHDQARQGDTDERVGDVPGDDRERETGAKDRDDAAQEVDADEIGEPEQAEHDREQDHQDQHDDEQHDEAEDRDDPPAGGRQRSLLERGLHRGVGSRREPDHQGTDEHDDEEVPDGVDDQLGRGRGRSRLPRLDGVRGVDRDVLGPTDRSGLRVCPGLRKHVARHRPVDGQPAGAGDEVFTDRSRRRDRQLPASREEILRDGATDRQRPAGDPRVATDRPADVDAATGREDVAGDGPVTSTRPPLATRSPSTVPSTRTVPANA